MAEENPNEGWDDFSYYVGRVGDFFDSLNASWSNSASAIDKQIINSAIGKFNNVTTLLPSMLADYNSLPPGATEAQRWQKVADGFINGTGSSLVVGSVAMGLGSAFGTPFGVMTGIMAGVMAGAALDHYVIGDFSPTNVIYNTYESYVSFGEWSGEANVLAPIIISSVPKTVVTISYENINQTFERINGDYDIDVSLDDFLAIQSRGDAFSFYYSLSEVDALALYRGGEVEVAITEFIEEYQENKDEIDAEDPSMADLVDQMQNAINFMALASNVMSPLVLDLDGDGIETVSIEENSAEFDFGTDVPLLANGWIGPNDGFLALDKDQNGKIDGLHELFGGRTTDGFSQLETYDGNGDGVIDQQDAVFADLLIWRDINSDGETQDGEIKSLTDHGIVSISLAAKQQVAFDNGNFIPLVSSFTSEDGSTRDIADVYFATREIAGEPYVAPDPALKVLIGSASDDILVGSASDQVYFGGSGNDSFVFSFDSGSDIVADFVSGSDVIDVTAWGAENIDDLEIELVSHGTIVSFGGNEVLLYGISEVQTSDLLTA